MSNTNKNHQIFLTQRRFFFFGLAGWLFHLPLVAVIVFYDNNATQYETIFSRGDRPTPPEQKDKTKQKLEIEKYI
jgi:hypothetical protein